MNPRPPINRDAAWHAAVRQLLAARPTPTVDDPAVLDMLGRLIAEADA